MSTTAAAARPGVNYLNVRHGVASWLLTKDHKRIAILYLIVVTVAFFLGGIFAAGIRVELTTPQGDFVSADSYNRLFTMHGIMMVFFVLIPAVPAVIGNFVLPLMIGAKDVAFPRINLISWYIFVIGFVFTVTAMVVGGVDTGWTFYTPYSSNYSSSNVLLTGIGIFITGFSSILTGLNFMVTIHRMRAPGMTWFRLPLLVWALYATSLVQILGTPVIAITVLMLAVERAFGFGIFDPRLGGDPVLFQHLFWFYSHPAVYIMILPPMGVISEVIACFARKRVFGYSFVAFSSLAIAIFGFLVWAHHLFVAGISPYSAMVFSFLSFAVAIPSAVKTFNWTATLYKGAIWWKTPMMFVFGFIGLFLVGGLTGLFLASLGLDIHMHDTYFVVAHFHYIMVGGAIMGYFAGLHFWWPKITGRMYSDSLGKLSALLIFVGFNLTFFPQFILGYLGMPRRYHVYPEEFQVLNVLSSAGASVLAVGYILPVCYFMYSLKKGQLAGDNPWLATGLEWQTQSPPLPENFPATPVVHEDAYEYAKREIKLPNGVAAHVDDHTHAHHPALQHHFETLEQQHEASTLGMWVFLVTEVMFFGGLFLAYMLYRIWYPEAWSEGSLELDIVLGGINTVVLIGSSLTMALAVRAAQTGKQKATVNWLLLTMALGLTFLVIKFFEYEHKFELNHVPGPNFVFEGPHADQVEIFISLYFAMTGLHALHMLIGFGILSTIAWMAHKGRFSPEWYTPVEMSGLYWHFVDIVWIFLFPLLYLVDRAHQLS